MLKVSRLKQIGEWLVESSAYLKKFVYAASEEDITALLKDVAQTEYPLLLGIIPSAGAGSSSHNNRYDQNFLFFYVLMDEDDFKGTGSETAWDLAADSINEVESILAENTDEPPFIEFREIDWGSLHKDPEHQWGKKGYSLSLQMIK